MWFKTWAEVSVSLQVMSEWVQVLENFGSLVRALQIVYVVLVV